MVRFRAEVELLEGYRSMSMAQDWEESWEVGARYVQNEWLLRLAEYIVV